MCWLCGVNAGQDFEILSEDSKHRENFLERALDDYVIHSENYDFETEISIVDLRMWKQWNNLYNPVLRNLGILVAGVEMTNKAQKID